MACITKKASVEDAHLRQYSFYDDARSAWLAIIEYYREKNPNLTLILPAYVGFSEKEGSGIFDPVQKTNVNFRFYGLSRMLKIDVNDLKSKVIGNETNSLVLLVHYFGFPDEEYKNIIHWLKTHNVPFIEDCAHAWLSDVIGGSCGREGSFSFYSIHKLLPFNYGGLLVNNKVEIGLYPKRKSTKKEIPVFDYDLKSIYDKRRNNYRFLVSMLKNIEDVELLYPELPNGIGPQTLPILVDQEIRDKLYFMMNDKGFGLVSLYHTMVDELADLDFESANLTSNQITNLPVHQDCNEADLKEMVSTLKNVISEL